VGGEIQRHAEAAAAAAAAVGVEPGVELPLPGFCKKNIFLKNHNTFVVFRIRVYSLILGRQVPSQCFHESRPVSFTVIAKKPAPLKKTAKANVNSHLTAKKHFLRYEIVGAPKNI
jgi:hypothetical protein